MKKLICFVCLLTVASLCVIINAMATKAFDSPAVFAARYILTRNYVSHIVSDDKKVFAPLIVSMTYGIIAVPLLILLTTLMVLVAMQMTSKTTLIGSILGVVTALVGTVGGVLLCMFARNKSNELLADVLLVGQQILVNHRHQHTAFIERLYDQMQIMGRCCGYEQYTDYFFMNYTSSHFFPEGKYFVCSNLVKQGAQDVPLSCCKSQLHATGLNLDCASNIFGTECDRLANAQDVDSKINTIGCRLQVSLMTQPFLKASWLFIATGLLLCCMTSMLVLILRDESQGARRLLPQVADMRQMGMGNDTIRTLVKAAKDTGLAGTSQINMGPLESKTHTSSNPT